jgi:hypothetical protein
MRRLSGALLIAVGFLGPALAVWWMFASGYMEESFHYRGPQALAGVILFGSLCVVVGIAIWIAPAKDRES